jgi:tRNA-Thr(GGU) m(6)t(6)A37 methyltransferase TsaA
MKDRIIELKPVGVVKTALSDDEVKENWHGGIEAEIKVFDEYSPALDGIEGFSHIILLLYLHETTEAQRKTLQARPRRFLKYGLKLEDLPLVGVFCLDSPHRPNPIGLTIVRLAARNGNTLKVGGLDAFNDTPVLDIKPYTPGRCISHHQIPDWFRSLLKQAESQDGASDSST